MKLYDLSIVLIITVVCLFAGMASIKTWGPDNVVEEISEEIIQEETGLDIDLSPSTKEK